MIEVALIFAAATLPFWIAPAVLAASILAEGARFLWRHRRASAAYVRWRLGTLYGSFVADGEPRPMKELLRALWRDRRGAVRYLLWRRRMRPGTSS